VEVVVVEEFENSVAARWIAVEDKSPFAVHLFGVDFDVVIGCECD
jgi:hypothetical protein